MTRALASMSPEEARRRIDAGSAILIDVRESDEFARRHVAGSLSRPLSQWKTANIPSTPGQDVIFTCRSGMRTEGACDQLAARVSSPAFMLEGGIDGWARTGLPLAIDEYAPLEIMRQVQIAVGFLTLVGVILGFTVAPGWFGLSAFVGAGLTFAGVTGFCGMARLLMLAPWNRPRSLA